MSATRSSSIVPRCCRLPDAMDRRFGHAAGGRVRGSLISAMTVDLETLPADSHGLFGPLVVAAETSRRSLTCRRVWTP